MTTRDYEDELQSERRYIAGLHARLDAERTRAKVGHTAALRGPIDVKDGGTLVQRDSEVRALAKEMRRLDVADNGLCCGRLDALDGEHSYIGRTGIFDSDDEYEPLLIDWRAPAARPFYTATGAHPEDMRRRRQFHTRGREVVDFTDEFLGRPDADERGASEDAALLAAVNTLRCGAPTVRPGRCRMCHCSTNRSTCSAPTSLWTTPPSGNVRPKPATPRGGYST